MKFFKKYKTPHMLRIVFLFVLSISAKQNTLHFDWSTGTPQRCCGSVSKPSRRRKYRRNASCTCFAGGGPCPQFVKNTTSVKHNKPKCTCIASTGAIECTGKKIEAAVLGF